MVTVNAMKRSTESVGMIEGRDSYMPGDEDYEGNVV